MASDNESDSSQSSGDHVLDDPVPKKRQYKDLVQKLQNFRVQTELDRMLLEGVFDSTLKVESQINRRAQESGVQA